jgi:signal peptidase II
VTRFQSRSHSPWRKGGGVIAGGVKFLALVVLPFYLLDQLTKWWVHTHYALEPTNREMLERFMDVVMKNSHLPLKTEVIPGWFNIVYHGNTGAAFSIGSGNNMGFVVLSVVAFIGLIIAWKKNVFPDRFSQWGVALILAGILGNVTDRLVHGYVIDFIQVDLHVRYANPWPTFNVADSCIFIAAGLFIIAGIRDARKPKNGPGEAGTK